MEVIVSINLVHPRGEQGITIIQLGPKQVELENNIL